MNEILGPDSPPRGARVVVAMSGGVDSALAAALCHEAGYEVVGLTLQLYDHGQAVGRPGSCCAGQDLRDARAVAARLGFAHYILDYEERFRRQVIDDFTASYARGETPIPCIRCNQKVKFADLLESARELEATCLVTGHYVQRVMGPAGPELHRAADQGRDQSYFLFTTSRPQLDFLRFPLGGLPKSEVRRMAADRGLAVAGKVDSQDICFIPQGRYATLVEKLRPEAAEPGEIVDQEGQVLGQHKGIIHFTVGQRRGLGLDRAAGALYVLRLDAERRQVVVGPEAALAQDLVILRETSWLEDLTPGRLLQVKLRSRQEPQPARLVEVGQETAAIQLLSPSGAVAAGQAAVAYDGERLLGGGFIAESRRATAVTETSSAA
ncbi:MAG: tRNA 2-thiouridine(34) synthase MnmA [Pseudomonadota bacterium]